MSDGIETAGCGAVPLTVVGSFYQQLSRYIGETITIFTTSGGESGSGFSGVLALVTPEYVRLVTSIGFPPECSLGNSCYGGGLGGGGFGFGYGGNGFGYGRFTPLGAVVNIPLARIASFAHNTL